MGLHKPFDRHFVTINGQVLKNGASLSLKRGVIGLFDANKQSKDGLEVVTNLAGKPRDSRYVLKMGNAFDGSGTRSFDNKSLSTIPFSLDQVVAVRASAPQIKEQVVDEVVLGYNGINPETSISFKKGDRQAIFLELCGSHIEYLGYPEGKVTVEYVLEADACNPFEDCVECNACSDVEANKIILNAVEFLQDFQLRGGVKMKEVVEITPVRDCETAPTYSTEEWSFYEMSVADMGDNVALAMVEAQYPEYKVTRKNRAGIITTYELVAPQGTVLTDYSQPLASILKGCEDCPAGYSEVAGGFMYGVTLEDNGDDETATVQALPNTIADSAVKYGQVDGVGYYTVLTSVALTDAQIATFVGNNKTATFTFVGETQDVCTNESVTEASWTATSTCEVTSEEYKIVLPDTECGQNRLTELQEVYPNNEIFLSGTNTFATTLTGTSGTANVVVNGTNYLATFDTDLTTTSANFVAAFDVEGITATSNAAVITFTGQIKDLKTVTVANVTGNLAGTAVLTQVVVTGGCQTEYITTQPTNMVCEECDPIYQDFFRSEQPAEYEGVSWTKVVGTEYENCKLGIRFKGRVLEMHPDDVFLDHFEHLEDSVKIQASGGYITEQREGVGRIMDRPMAVTYLSRFKPRTHAGGNLRQYERQGNWFFNGIERSGDLLKRRLTGQETTLDSNTQYVDFAIEVKDKGYSQSMGQSGFNTSMIYHILVPFGKHNDVQDMVNLIAGGAGLAPVSI